MTTPMMAQWEACKQQAKDALLLFRLGDFYEAFYDDAKRMSKEIGLTLTARQGIPMCGVPFHTAESYVDKLIAKGYKVAVAEQTEDPKATKGLVRREIVRIVSPGTIVNSQLLTDKRNNYFVAVAQVGTLYGMAALDVTTGEFRTVEVEQSAELIDELYRLRPTELLISKKFKQAHAQLFIELSHGFPYVLNEKEEWRFDSKAAHDLLLAHFEVQTLDGFGLKGQLAAIAAAGALVGYLKQELGLRLDHVRQITSEALQNYLSLDRSTVRNLELTESSTHADHTLLSYLDRTATPMGGRLLRHWIKHPLLSLSEIEERQEALADFLKVPEASRRVHQMLGEVRDLERLMMKITARYATPRDLLALGLSLSHLPAIRESLSSFTAKELIVQREALSDPISSKICASLSESPPLRLGEGEIFKDGVHPELDRLRTLSRDSLSWMTNYQMRLREETGIKTLKVSYTKAFGYYIEVTRAQSEKIPPIFQRRQTLVNAERFITDELRNYEHQVLTAEERSKALEAQLFEELRAEVAKHAATITFAAKAVSRIDVLLALSLVADENGLIQPKLDTSDVLDIIEGRHPIVEQSVGRASFIPNDTALSQKQQLMLITGPNMAGKSTYIRQVALIVILAQMGSYVPARSARIGLTDKIFSRIGASDDLARGQSTFMVEMAETANILNNATSRSLVLLDEIGRGTSTYDGISIAWAVAEYLLTTEHKQAKTLFATHYWELTRLEKEIPGAVNYQVAVQETTEGIVFLRKILRGGTDKSYGIHVAKLAGLPYKAIKRAEEMLYSLEAAAPRGKKKAKEDDQQLSLLPPPATDPRLTDLIAQLRSLEVDRLTPLEGLIRLSELHRRADSLLH
ncbi:MAG: DNA mismatch repair protein MutS [Verrucomicrobiota bacterium]|nr:DNA mismatch repair protein MutS [Verrucomicrobiota bacterium]